jgi:GH18 family chitinase
MSYDFHGTWDKGNFAKLNAPIVDCHSRQCNKPFDIDTCLSQYLAGGVPKEKIVLGLAFYGRALQLTQAVDPADAPVPGPGTKIVAGRRHHMAGDSMPCALWTHNWLNACSFWPLMSARYTRHPSHVYVR